MEESRSSSVFNKGDFNRSLMNPTTPEKDRRLSSSVPKLEESAIPSTPPSTASGAHGRRDSIPDVTFKSPDAYTHAITILPPMTPSSHRTSVGGAHVTRMGNGPMTPLAKLLNNETADSPLKSPSQFQEEEEDSAEKPPIRAITNKLRTRLNFAMVKYSNGWTNQSLDELEKNVLDKDAEDEHHDISFLSKTKSPSKVTKPSYNSVISPRRAKRGHRRSMEPLDAGGSANIAFLQAISKSLSPKRRPRLNTTGLRIESNSTHDSPEAEAIETLMSLSSPRSLKRLELAHRALPSQRLSFGEQDEGAIQTESETEDEGDATTTTTMTRTDEQLTDSAPGSPS